jgi:peptidoglycan/LPS O-acetylase OafA/YrhL
LRRNASLDALRCAAILLVLGRHCPYYSFWERIGWAGVDLFFVLSGFLISGLLFQDYLAHGSINWRRFAARRALKIYPPLLAAIAAAVAIFVVRTHRFPWTELLVACSFVQNYFLDRLLPQLGPTWSLGVEEVFYFLLPILLIRLSRRRTRDPFSSIPAIFCGLAVASLVIRWFSAPPFYASMQTHARIDSLFAGVTLCYLFHFRRSWFEKLSGSFVLPVAFLFLLPLALLTTESRALKSFGILSMTLGFTLLVAWSAVRAPRSSLGTGVLKVSAQVGFYSYSIYLWHMFFSPLVLHFNVTAAGFWLFIVIAILVGVTMANLIELPVLVLRDRWFPSLSGTASSR